MEAVQLKKFKCALKNQQTVAIHDLGENREIIAIERNADEMDVARRSADDQFAIPGPNRRSQRLRNIEARLRRIGDGSFGSGVNCDENVGRNRLFYVPWTPLN